MTRETQEEKEEDWRLPPPTKVVDLPHLRNARHPLRREVDQINYENTFFFDRVQRRRQEPSKIDHFHVERPTSGSVSRAIAKRKLKQLKEEEVEMENAALEKRIQDATTYYPTEKAEEAFERHRTISARIRQYEDTDEEEDEEKEDEDEDD